MKLKALFLHILIVSSTLLCYAQVPHGIDLSNSIYEICKSNDIKPETLNLVSNVKNEFPYNILVSFPAAKNEDAQDESLRNTLLVLINQEDAYKNKEILTKLLIKLSSETHDFNIKILLPFGDNQDISKKDSVSGSISFISTLDDASKYSCIIVSPGEEKSNIISGAGEMISPTWFVKNVYSAYKKNSLLKRYDNNYISYIYRLNIFDEPVQKAFLESEIPCIKAMFKTDVSPEIISDTILAIIENYNPNETYQSDYHSIMYSIFSKQLWFSEDLIIKSILVSLLVTLLIIFTYGFINEQFKFVAWHRIRKIWHYPIAIYFLSFFFFMLNRDFLRFITSKFSITFSLYISILFVISVTFIVVFIAFLFAIRNEHNFKKKTVDYLVLITGIADLFIFCLIDISLFPIFAFEFILGLIATILKRNYSHFFILAFYSLPFVPFVLQILNNSNLEILNQSLFSYEYISGPIILIILPEYFTCFRLFTSFNYYWFKKQVGDPRRDYYNIIALTGFLSVSVFMISIIVPKKFKTFTKGKFDKTFVISETKEKSLSVETSVRYVFGDAIRTIKIDTEKKVKQCDLRIRGTNSAPVLFSDYDYIFENPNEAVFMIPYEPPSKMEFSYGESEEDAEIIVTVTYDDFTMERFELTNKE